MRNKVSRREVVDVLAKSRLAVCDSGSIRDFLEDYHRDPQLPATEVAEALMDHYDGVSNGFLSDLYEAITGEQAEVVGECAELFPCPCCSFRTLHEQHDLSQGTGYDICPYCNWEDDGAKDPDEPSTVNSGSMADYRRRIEQEPNFYHRSKWFSSSDPE